MSLELAWSAGFFDGEGSTHIENNRKGKYAYQYLQVQVWQKDRRPLERLFSAVGVGRMYGPYKSKGDQSLWRARGADAERVIELLWPYLSEPKQEQIIRVRAAFS